MPDADGLQMLTDPFHPRRRISGRRQRRAASIDVGRIIWRKEELALLRELIPNRSTARSWVTIERIAGTSRTDLVRQLIHNLLIAGLVVVTEQKPRAADWRPVRVDFADVPRARALAGLPDLAARAREAEAARRYLGQTPPVCELAASLGGTRDDIAVRRSALLRALDRWIESGRSGTRYDFALFATGRTKGIPRSDWEWLIAHDALESASIADHEPIIRVAGRWTLHLDADARMDFGRPPAPGGLAPTTIAGARAVTGVTRWVIVENRTVFDRAARFGGSAILWTPGYSPEWWLDAVSRLVDLAPVPLCIACDPDPAGIAIALRASSPWRGKGLPWSTAGMSLGDLQSLPARMPLSDADQRILESIQTSELDPILADLHQHLPALGKGEQEGYFDEAALRQLLAETLT